MADFPLVSIISVNYNQAQVTCAMLASLQKISYPNIEIIIVDNASPTDDPKPILDNFPSVKLIKSAKNLGFAGGNNIGIWEAKGSYILFLNNDTEVEPDFLEPLVNLFQTNKTAGIASPKIIFYGTDNIIQYAGSTAISPWTGRGHVIGNMEKDEGQHNISLQTNLAHGAAMLIPREVIKKVGLMPELYFLYYEEHDWCEMIKRAGYTCHYVADSTVYHKESVSVGRASPMKVYYNNRNRLVFMRRNSWGMQFWVGLLYFLVAAIPKNTLQFALKFQFKFVKALWQGLFWNISHPNVQQNHYLTD